MVNVMDVNHLSLLDQKQDERERIMSGSFLGKSR